MKQPTDPIKEIEVLENKLNSHRSTLSACYLETLDLLRDASEALYRQRMELLKQAQETAVRP